MDLILSGNPFQSRGGSKLKQSVSIKLEIILEENISCLVGVSIEGDQPYILVP